MSDYLEVSHNAETGEEAIKFLTQEEIDELNATFTGINEGSTVELETTGELPTP